MYSVTTTYVFTAYALLVLFYWGLFWTAIRNWANGDSTVEMSWRERQLFHVTYAFAGLFWPVTLTWGLYSITKGYHDTGV